MVDIASSAHFVYILADGACQALSASAQLEFLVSISGIRIALVKRLWRRSGQLSSSRITSDELIIKMPIR